MPRELPEESPEREEPAEPPPEPGEGTGVRRRHDGSAGLRRADRRLARLVRVEAAGALRLCSIVYETLWTPRQELVASCRSSEYRLKPELPAKHTRAGGGLPLRDLRLRVGCRGHALPQLLADTGTADPRLGARPPLALGQGGRVPTRLARRARPPGQHLRSSAQRARTFLLACSPGAETVALALGSAGVPIESVARESVAELARRLGGERVQA